MGQVKEKQKGVHEMAKKLRTFTDDRQVQKYEAKKENKKRSLQRKVKRGDWIK